MKKAQGLQISTIILAILGITVLVVLIGMVITRTTDFGQGVTQSSQQICEGGTLIYPGAPCDGTIIYGRFVEDGKIASNKVCCKS